jgi:hypothetical protein
VSLASPRITVDTFVLNRIGRDTKSSAQLAEDVVVEWLVVEYNIGSCGSLYTMLPSGV